MPHFPGLTENPFQAILTIGELRREASQKLEQAGVLEGMAKVQLAGMGINLTSRALPPRQTLAQPFGGPAHGRAQYVPIESLPFFSLVAPTESGVVAPHEYQVGMLIRVGQNFVAAVLAVPKDELGAMYEKMRQRDPDIHLAVTEMLVRATGLNVDLIDHVVSSMQHTAELSTAEQPEDPIVIMLSN